jgi:hypothetical protein
MPKQTKSFEDWYAACIKEADKAVPLSEKTWDVNAPGAMRTLYDRGWSVKKAVAARIATGDLGKMFDALEDLTRNGLTVRLRSGKVVSLRSGPRPPRPPLPTKK